MPLGGYRGAGGTGRVVSRKQYKTCEFKSGFESRERFAGQYSRCLWVPSRVRQCWTIVWRMMSVEMARTAVGRMKIECCVRWCATRCAGSDTAGMTSAESWTSARPACSWIGKIILLHCVSGTPHNSDLEYLLGCHLFCKKSGKGGEQSWDLSCQGIFILYEQLLIINCYYYSIFMQLFIVHEEDYGFQA